MKEYYSRNGITIYHGDALEVWSALALEDADTVVTDPPYGISYSPAGGGTGWTVKTFTSADLVRGDNAPFDPSFLLTHPRLVLFGANHYADHLPPRDSWIIWDKRVGIPSNDFADCEMAWCSLGGPARVVRHLWNGAFRASERGEQRVHPTQKPLAVMRWIVERYTLPAGRVVDPYMGSGTTLAAAKTLGRRAIGIEIEEHYCEIAAKRLSQDVLPLFSEVTS